MNHYKVQFKITETYVIDERAENETEAEEKASIHLAEKLANGSYHYYESEDSTTNITVFDVTNTDDLFNPE